MNRDRLISRRNIILAAGGLLARPYTAMADHAAGLPQAAPVVAAMERLSDQLLANGALRDGRGNSLLSPWSIHATLSMLAFGSDDGVAHHLGQLLGHPPGATLANALRTARRALVADSTVGAQVRRSEAAWVRSPACFRPDWSELVDLALELHGEQLDFASPSALQEINGWAARATDGEIPQILGRLPPDAELVLASAIHFAGRWEIPFDPAATAPGPFSTQDGREPEIPLMHAECPAMYGRAGAGHGVTLRYAGGRIAMTLGTAARLQDASSFFSELRERGVFAWFRSVPFTPVPRLSLRLPRLTLEGGGNLLDALDEIGAASLMPRGRDFSRITQQPLTLSALLHRARLRMDEQGTVAAASSAAIASRALPMQMPVFAADRPFAFVIWGGPPYVPLFAGCIGDAGHGTA